MSEFNIFFVVAGSSVVVALVGVALWYRAAQPADLGTVSHTWIAELRAGDPYDSSR